MRTFLRIHGLFTLVMAVLPVCFAQTDPKNVPQPPTAELKKFDPFLGKFSVSGNFANLPWTGTLELKKVIKGWYIEQIILIKSEGIDREFRILATWDKNLRKYRLWGFQTLPIMPDNGGEIRFEGDEMSTEWISARPDGSKAAFSNRYKIVSKDELEILSYSQVGNGPAEKIGYLRGKRTLNAEEAAASPPSNSLLPAPEDSMKPTAEDEIHAAMAERRRASLEGDSEKIASSMADEYIQTDISGYVQDKTAWLNEYFNPLAALIKAGRFRWDVFEEKDVQIRTYGDTAIVIGTLELTSSGARVDRERHTWIADAEAHRSSTLHFTRTYIKRNGKWLLAALHNAIPLQQSSK